jgi:NAD(P)-dependent dehydrogenase (short-subunit alcohol dehydrogenase family)
MSNVLITGCSSGFGLLTAQTFARRGDNVFATVRDLANADALERIRDGEDLPISILQLDVRYAASVHAAVTAALDRGPIDVLVNNAGYALRSSVEETEDDEIRQEFETNVFGVVRLIRAVAPGMRARGSGTIVNVSSVTAWAPLPFSGPYAASKAAVSALSESLHYELSPFGVRIVLVEPGPYPTTGFPSNSVIGRNGIENSQYAELRARYQSAAGRILGDIPSEPQEVADAICDAVYSDTPRFRYVVGDVGQRIVNMRRESTDFEEFAGWIAHMLGWQIRATPARAARVQRS